MHSIFSSRRPQSLGRVFKVFYRLLFCTISKKTDAARITKLDTKVFPEEAQKPIYSTVKGSKVKVTCSSMDEITFISGAGFM